MSNTYRPKEWSNPYEIREPHNDAEWTQRDAAIAYESGADAILEELKLQDDSQHTEAYQEHSMTNGVAGTWIFIPDSQ